MFKNILNLQNHGRLIYHYLRNENKNTPGFPTNRVTISWSTRSEVRLLHFSMQQSLRKQTEINQINGNRETAALLWFWDLLILDGCASERCADFPTHQPGFSLGHHCWSPRAQGSWQDITSKWRALSTNCCAQAQLGLCCPFQQHYPREMLPISTLVLRPFTTRMTAK